MATVPPDEAPNGHQDDEQGPSPSLREIQLLLQALCEVEGITRGNAIVIAGAEPGTLFIIVREVTE